MSAFDYESMIEKIFQTENSDSDMANYDLKFGAQTDTYVPKMIIVLFAADPCDAAQAQPPYNIFMCQHDCSSYGLHYVERNLTSTSANSWNAAEK